MQTASSSARSFGKSTSRRPPRAQELLSGVDPSHQNRNYLCMRVILQRVSEASVSVSEEVVSRTAAGLLLLVGIADGEQKEVLAKMAEKIAHLRVFPDENGKFHHSILETKGEILAVPQFTLFADIRKGRRPEFFGAMRPPLAEEYFDAFVNELENQGIGKVGKGVFGAHMHIASVNDGPVTFQIEMS